MKCRLYLNQDMYDNGEFNTIITKDEREIDYTHWEDENGNCKVSDKLVYEGENDFTVVHCGINQRLIKQQKQKVGNNMNDCIGSAVTVMNAYIGNKLSNLFGGCYEIEYKKEQHYFDNEITRNMIESKSNLK